MTAEPYRSDDQQHGALDASGDMASSRAETQDSQGPDEQSPQEQNPEQQGDQPLEDDIETPAGQQPEDQQPEDQEVEPAAADRSEAPPSPASDEAAAQPPIDEPGVAPQAAGEAADEPVEAPAATGPAASGPIEETPDEEEEAVERPDWYILKVQVNRENSIADALQRRVKIEGMEEYFHDIVVPTETVAEFTKTGKRRNVKRKLFPGYIVVNMVINDDTWFLVRETPGIGDFTGAAGKPTAMEPHEVERILHTSRPEETGEEEHVRPAIPFTPGDRVRVKEGNFENYEGDVETINEVSGHVVVTINIFNRSVPVELAHWQIEKV